MPRYRFRWEIVPRPITRRLARDLRLEGQPVQALQSRYGMRPTVDLVRDAWPTLRDFWLARDTVARRALVAELRAQRLGRDDLPIRNRLDQLAYLASCRNSQGLRQLVLAAFLELGDVGPSERSRHTERDTAQGSAGTRSSIDASHEGDSMDRALDSAWASFEGHLTTTLARLIDHQVVVLDLPSAYRGSELRGAAPYIQFTGYDAGERLRGEVSSDAFLDPHHQLVADQIVLLDQLGWLPPTFAPGEQPDQGSPNYWADLPTSESADFARMAVTTARSVFGVPHPSFLAATGFGTREGVEDPEVELGIPLEEEAHPAVAELADLVQPSSHGHLRELVDESLALLLGARPAHDADDDIPIPSGSAIVFVRVAQDAPVVELFAPLLKDVHGTPLTLERLNNLNKTYRFVTFTWRAGQVLAASSIWCAPFVSDLLHQAVTALMEVADEVDDRLVAELGGRHYFGGED